MIKLQNRLLYKEYKNKYKKLLKNFYLQYGGFSLDEISSSIRLLSPNTTHEIIKKVRSKLEKYLDYARKKKLPSAVIEKIMNSCDELKPILNLGGYRILNIVMGVSLNPLVRIDVDLVETPDINGLQKVLQDKTVSYIKRLCVNTILSVHDMDSLFEKHKYRLTGLKLQIIVPPKIDIVLTPID